MAIVVNGTPRALPVPPTLEGLLHSLGPKFPFAVACNGEFVPAAEYEHCLLSDGDCVEVVHPSAGG